jgi:hypothetical protein
VRVLWPLSIHSLDDEFEVRLDFDIPPEEKEFLKKRKVLVGQALQKELGLSSSPDPKKVHGDEFYALITHCTNGCLSSIIYTLMKTEYCC